MVERLTRGNVPVRIGSRSGGLPFDWNQPSTWGPVFKDVEAAYTYVRYPVLAGGVGEPFTDADDIADVAATVLTEDGNVGATYEVTGPRPLTFAEVTATIAEATGRDIAYTRIPPEDFAAGLATDGVPQDVIDFLVDLFGTVLDGRNASVGNGVERALGRPARDFVDYARVTAARGVWTATDQPNPGSPR